MRKEDFKPNSPGTLIMTMEGQPAFVPFDLPPEVQFTPRLLKVMSDADRAVGELAGVGHTLQNPHLLIRPFLSREAVLSSKIEGTHTSVSQLALFEATERPQGTDSDEQEVHNYIRALQLGLGKLDKLPISLRLLREMHAILLTGVRGEDKRPGEFRNTQNWIGARRIVDAEYVPPPVPEMLQAIDQLEKYIHETSELPPLVRMALIHYQFEAIHPFADGNGRIGRLLIILQMCAEGILPQPLLYLSAYFEANRLDYYERLLAVSQDNDWEGWVEIFLLAVESQSKDAISRSKRLVNLREAYRERLERTRASALLLQLVDCLFEWPAITSGHAMRLLSVTRRAAQLNINRLCEGPLPILEEATGRPQNRVYLAREIVDILEEQ